MILSVIVRRIRHIIKDAAQNEQHLLL